MNILFFFVHPAKFHVFRPVIDRLMEEGHHVDVAIISKDVLPQLIETTDWNCVNIFPEGRTNRATKRITRMFITLINAFKTAWRLYRYIKKQNIRYNLFVTDDCLSFVGKAMRVPVLFFLDDDISVVPENAPLLQCATKILAPAITNIGRFGSKKIPFAGYKEACYLMPKYFTPDSDIPHKYGLQPGQYVFIRLVSLSATHDFGKQGISDERLATLVNTVEDCNLQPVLSLERAIPQQYEKYRLKCSPDETIHILAHAALYWGDSQTMTSEAVLLGVPAIRCNDFVGKISVMDEKESKYGMTYGFLPKDFDLAIEKTKTLLKDVEVLSAEWQAKHKNLLSCIEDIPEKMYAVIKQFER